MMNKIYNSVVLIMLVLFVTTFGSCSKDDDSNGSSAVVLEAYGPSPALRGGELTFVGKNMDKVSSIILPDKIEITDINFVSKEKIKITIPQNAKEGFVKLLVQGDTIRTKTLLTYTEPISISKFTSSPVKPGQTLVIEGDYLNLILKVVFADGVEVSYKDFQKWERGKIEVVVPREAQTGTIILADTAAIPIELKSETQLQVVLPSVQKISNLTNKKPGDVVSVSGKDFDLIESVKLPDGKPVEFKVKDNSLTFTLPEGITDGEISMVAYSGVQVIIANIGMAVPTQLVATPATGIKGGSEISVKGVNMDLVTTVLFAGVSTPVTPISKSATEIKLSTPDKAIAGDLVLNTASGKTVSVKIATLKPEVLSYNPSTVAAGKEFTIKGKNLELVASVTFGGDKTVEVISTSSTDLKVKAPVDAETGELVLKMKNGETVKAPVLTISKPEFCYVPVLPDSNEEIKSGSILQLEVQNADKLINVQVKGNNVQYILQGTTLSALIPNNANGNTEFTLISSNGQVTYTIYVIAAGIVETAIFEGPLMLTWGDGGRIMLPISSFDKLPAGAILKLYFTQNANWGQIQMNYGDWSNMPFIEVGGAYITTDVLNDKSKTELELMLTQDVLDNIVNNQEDNNGIIMQGSEFIIDKISIITGR